MSLANHAALSSNQKAILRRGKITTVSELIITSTQDIARKCKVAPTEIEAIVAIVCKSKLIQAQTLAELLSSPNSYGICTSGDTRLDAALGGGFRTGMVWEVVGESAAGKTQLGLRMSLLAQLSPEHGGLAGSACYLLTSGKLPTSRLVQIADSHPLLASLGQSSLNDIHTMPIPTITFLVHALSELLPVFIQQKLKQHQSNSTVKPVKLVVIDALGELFHSSDKTSTQTLVERSKNIAEISACLHSIASTYGIVMLILNEVVDSIDRNSNNDDGDPSIGLSYATQSRWFGRAHSIPGEDWKEASLGLVWANQVNARIMMSRTGRRRFLQSERPLTEKRQRTDSGYSTTTPFSSEDSDNLELIRRLSIVFSSVSSPASFDYIVDSAGITILEDDDLSLSSSAANEPVVTLPPPTGPLSAMSPASQIAPLDVGSIEGENAGQELPPESSIPPSGEAEWDAFWENDELTQEMLDLADAMDPGQPHEDEVD